MDYQIDLDPTHAVIRLTVTAETITLEMAEEVYMRLKWAASRGGPYAAICDLSRVRHAITANAVKDFAFRPAAVPEGRIRVVVAKDPSVFGMARMLQLYRDFNGGKYEVVHSLAEAYHIVGVRPEDFTQRLFPEKLAA